MGFYNRLFKKSPDEGTGVDKRDLTVTGKGARIWAVGGGKGGVGKSFVAANFGVLLVSRGKRVLLVDTDLGAANLHSFFGVECSGASLSSFLKKETDCFDSLITSTDLPGLDMVTGGKDSLDVADVEREAISRLKGELARDDYDYVILDVGPGTATRNLELLLSAHNAVILTTPEPTSVENTYRYLKCIVLTRIKNILNSGEEQELRNVLLKILKGRHSDRIRTVADIMLLLKRGYAGKGIERVILGSTALSLIINQARYEEDGKVGPQMETLCRNHLGINVEYIGALRYSEEVPKSVSERRPLATGHAGTPFRSPLDACLEILINKQENPSTLKKLTYKNNNRKNG